MTAVARRRVVEALHGYLEAAYRHVQIGARATDGADRLVGTTAGYCSLDG
ncbi:MAG: hypothetical protein WBA45_00875 [Microthrixaceae bacterium]